MYKYAVIRNGSLSSYKVIDSLSEIVVPIIPVKVMVNGTAPVVVHDGIGETVEFKDADVEKTGYVVDRLAKVELFNYDDGKTTILSFDEIEKISGSNVQTLEEQFPDGFKNIVEKK